MSNKFKLGFKDLQQTIANRNYLWFFLALQEIKLRYKRSVIGPLWITISTGIFIFTLGPLYGTIFSKPVDVYIRYFSASYIIWGMLSSTIIDSCVTFTSNEGFIKEVRIPYNTYIFKNITKNFLIFLHNIIIVFVVMFFFPLTPNLNFFLIIPGIILFFINLYSLNTIIAIICTRYRDLSNIVQVVLQMMFFLTPILWEIDRTNGLQKIALFNPLFHMIDIVRAPMLGIMPFGMTYILISISAFILFIVAMYLLNKKINSISLWL
jgi:ABC-type polysaccharide/polyol phosphate export permease